MSKYNNKKTVIDGVKFDSKAESLYYLHLKELQQQGVITDFILQPKYILQEKFEKNGKKYREITYKADFEVMYANGDVEVVDVKGMLTDVFKLKMKLFNFHFDKTLKLITYNTKKYEFETLEDSIERKKQAKLTKKTKHNN